MPMQLELAKGDLKRLIAKAGNRETWLQSIIEQRLLPPPSDYAPILAKLRKKCHRSP